MTAHKSTPAPATHVRQTNPRELLSLLDEWLCANPERRLVLSSVTRNGPHPLIRAECISYGAESEYSGASETDDSTEAIRDALDDWAESRISARPRWSNDDDRNAEWIDNNARRTG